MKKSTFMCVILLIGMSMIYSATGNIKVVKPADRDTFFQDQTMTIKWKTQGNLPSQVKIQLIDRTGNHFVKTIAGGTPNDRAHQWRIPANLNPGEYRVLIIAIGSNVKAHSGLFKVKAKLTPTWEAPMHAMISSVKVNQESPANSCNNLSQRVSINLSEGIHIWVSATSVYTPIQYKYKVVLVNPSTGYEYAIHEGNWTSQALLNLNPTYDQVLNTIYPNGIGTSEIPVSHAGRVTVWAKNDAQTTPPQVKDICFRLWF